MYKKSIYCIIILLLSINCTRQKKVNIPIIEVNTANKAMFSELFKEITIVPLETDTSGLLGLLAYRIEVFKDKIFILNQLASHKNVLCFDSSGRFLFVIDRLGLGPNEYTSLSDFFIDRKRENLILNTENSRYFRFDLSGQFLEKIHTDSVYFARQMCYLNDSTALAFNDQSTLPKGIDLLKINLNTFNIEKKSVARSFLSGFLTPRLPISVYSKQVLFYDATDTIYDVSDISKRIAKYSVNFGHNHRKSINTIAQGISNSTDNELLGKFKSLFTTKQLMAMFTLFENSRFLVIGYAENSVPSKDFTVKNSFLLYDKMNQKAYNSANIAFDVLNLSNMGNISILGKYDEAFYALFTPELVPQSKEKILQSKNLSEEMISYIKEGSDDNNPLLIIFK